MRISLISSLFFTLVFLSFKGIAQSKIPYLNVSDMSVEQVYGHLKSFLLDNDYFVNSMDSNQAFVQVKMNPTGKSIFKRAVRNTINFFVVPIGDTGSKIRLQINSEILDWNGNVGNSSHYYKDSGILKAESSEYDDIISRLKDFYDQL